MLRPYPVSASIETQELPLNTTFPIVIVGGNDTATSAIVARWQQRHFTVRRVNWIDEPTLFANRISGLIMIAPVDDREVNRKALRWMQVLSPALRSTAESDGACLMAVTRLGGDFGLSKTCLHPESAGLAGLVKTARHEWGNVNCRVIDIDDETASVQQLAQETTWLGPIELGISATGRCELKLESCPHGAHSTSQLIEPGDLVVISGGARGVTAEAALALAKAYRPTLLLLGRSPLPDAEPEWLQNLSSPTEIKKALLDHAPQRLTPKQLNEEFQRVMTGREIHINLRRLRDAGSQVEYHAVDIRDRDAVGRIISATCKKHGPVRGIVHGAGVLADRRIEDKTLDQFDAVYQTKVEGLRSMLASTNDDLKFMALYSSSTARFGRTGQCDYAAANEVLNAIARQLSHDKPRCRVVSLNWGPWEGGMVTPGLRTLFESEGVGLIPLTDGGRFLVDELNALDRPTDVVVLGPAPKSQTLELNLNTYPWLTDHQLNDQPVLPLAVMIEAFAQSTRPFVKTNAGLAIEQIRVRRPLTVTNGEPLRLQIEFDNSMFLLSNLDDRHQGRPSCSARLADMTAPRSNPTTFTSRRPFPLSVRDAYEQVLFHGPSFQCITSIDGYSSSGIRVQCHGSPRHVRWWKGLSPTDRITDPLAIDAALQAIILWAWAERGEFSIPVAVGRYQQHLRDFPLGPYVIDVTVGQSKGQVFHASAIISDERNQCIAELIDCEYVATPDLARAFGKTLQRVP